MKNFNIFLIFLISWPTGTKALVRWHFSFFTFRTCWLTVGVLAYLPMYLTLSSIKWYSPEEKTTVALTYLCLPHHTQAGPGLCLIYSQCSVRSSKSLCCACNSGAIDFLKIQFTVEWEIGENKIWANQDFYYLECSNFYYRNYQLAPKRYRFEVSFHQLSLLYESSDYLGDIFEGHL